MLRQRRVHVKSHRNLSYYNHAKKEKMKSKYLYRCKCKTEANQTNFLGMDRFKDKSTSLLSKLIWVIVIISCLTGCILQISIRVTAFLDDAVMIEVKLTHRTSVIFPSITACNLNLFKFILSTNESKSNEDINHIDMDQLWTRLGMDSENMSVTTVCADALRDSCEKAVTEAMMVEFVDTMFGRCIMLSMKSKMDFRGQDTYATFTWVEMERLNDYKSGLLFFIHQDMFHHVYDGCPLMEYANFGYSTEYRIYSKELQNLNTYQHPCLPEEVAVVCLNDCINKEMIRVSSCGLPFVNNSNVKQCTNIKEIKENYYEMFPIWSNMTQYFEKCACHRKCNEILYVLNQNDKSKTESNETKIHLLYSGDKDEINTEKKMLTAAALFSDIGGTLGLYLGISIVAIVDFLENIIRHFCFSKY